MPPRRVDLTWTDEHGRDAHHTLRVDASTEPDSAPLASALAALQSLSRSSLSRASVGIEQTFDPSLPPDYGASPCSTYCVLVFHLAPPATSGTASFSFPGPLPSLFLSDGLVDAESPLITDLIAAIQFYVCTSLGQPLGEFAYGYRSTSLEAL